MLSPDMHAPPLAIQWNGQLERGQSAAAPNLDQVIRSPMWVDEIVITLSTQSENDFGTVLHKNWMDSVRLYFRVGDHEITTGKQGVSVNMLAPNMFANERITRNQDDTGLVPWMDQDLFPEISYNWKLPKPLFVVPGARLYLGLNATNPAMSATDDTAPFSNAAKFNFWISLLCRRVNPHQPLPSVVHVPFVAQYKTKAHTIDEDNWEESSQDTDIVNGFAQPIHLKRMIGSMSTQFTPTEVMDAEVRIADKAGAFIVREYTPVLELFSGFYKALDLEGCVLPPGDFYTIDVSVKDTTDLLIGSEELAFYTEDSEIIGNFSLIGHRDLPLNEVYPAQQPMPVSVDIPTLGPSAARSIPMATSPKAIDISAIPAASLSKIRKP